MQCRVRRYPTEQRNFLNKYVQKLVEYGFFIENKNASWQAAPHIVPKHGSKVKYRTVVDLRPVNSATKPVPWPMPNLEAEMQDFSNSKFFASLDFCSGYWQLPLCPSSYDSCGVVCPMGVFSSTRVLQGLKNATSYFQSTVEPLFSNLRKHLKAWLDDFNLHGESENELLDYLEEFILTCKKYGLFLSAKKCTFFAKEIKWCGRIIDSSGFRMDPRNAEGLKNMHSPVTADELCQFVHCCRWMAGSIPDFARRTAPLVAILEEAYKISGSRKKKSIKNIKLSSLSWGAEQENAFKSIQETLQNSIKLCYPRKEKTICVYTDASDNYWSGIVTQIDPEDLKKPALEQVHEPLAFIGSAFTGAERNWSTYEKEGFAIFKVFERLDYLLLGEQPVHVFTDHRNLLYVFCPSAFDSTVGKHIVSKVQRWAMLLSRFQFVIEHIEGELNIFADILTRWTRGYRQEQVKTGNVCSLVRDIVPNIDEISLPSLEKIRESQEKYLPQYETLSRDANGIVRKNGKMVIPDDDELKLKILVASHCGPNGHRGKESTESIIRENFSWEGIKSDIDVFGKSCIHCIVTRSGEIIPRPLGSALHASRPNEVIHMDFLFMGDSGPYNPKYTLILKDDFSSYVWLWPSECATGANAADALSTWISSFGQIDWLVTDQGSHFSNELMRGLTKDLHTKHHFTTAYCPWANGTVERVCREVIRASRALLSEMRLPPKDWPAVLEAVQCVINQAPLKRLGFRTNEPSVYRTPLEVFTGHLPGRPLIRALPVHKYQHASSLDLVKAEQLMKLDELQSAFLEMHKDVSERIDQSRKKQREIHSAKTNVHPVQFHVGDFVLIKSSRGTQHKLQPKWIGPRRIVSCESPMVFTVQNIITKETEKCHARRMIHYMSKREGTEVNEKLLSYAQFAEENYQVVKAIRNIGQNQDGTFLQIEWEGLPDTEDFTWEPVRQVKEDVPGLLEDFLHSPGNRVIKRSTLAQFY